MKKIISISFLSLILLYGTLLAKEYKFEYQKDIDVTGKAELRVSNTAGIIKVTGGPVNKISVHAVKNVRAADPDEAEKVSNHIEIRVSKTGNRVLIATNYIKMTEGSRSIWQKIFGGGEDSFGAVDYDIVVPLDCGLDIENVSGDVTVSDLNEEVYVAATSGNLYVHNIRGKVDLEATSGDIRVAEIGGDIRISAISSDVRVDSITGAIDIRSTSGNTSGRRIFGSMAISETSGDVELEDLTGDIRVKSTSGKITARQDSGSVDIVTNSGDVDLESSIYSGGNYYVESGSGRIYFAVPSTSSGSVDMQTISGDIRSDMPMTVKSRSSTRLQGDFGKDGPEIILKTQSGDISFGQY